MTNGVILGYLTKSFKKRKSLLKGSTSNEIIQVGGRHKTNPVSAIYFAQCQNYFFKHFLNYLSLGFSINLLDFSSEAQGPYNLALFNQ